MEKIGRIEEFHSEKCFDLYMYAVGFAKQINSYLDAGYLVFDNCEVFKNKFIFHNGNNPRVATKIGICNTNYIDFSFDNEGNICITGNETKESIKNRFSKFKFVKPCNIEKLKFQ